MYCPNCGKANSSEQKYCRGCGLSLEKIVKSLAEVLPEVNFDRNLQARTRKVDRWLAIIAGGGISLFVGLILWGIIYKIIILKGDVGEGLVFLGFILGLIVFGLLALYRDWLQKASSKRTSPQVALPRNVDTSQLLYESRMEPVATVTDRTTELLPVEQKSRTKRITGHLEDDKP